MGYNHGDKATALPFGTELPGTRASQWSLILRNRPRATRPRVARRYKIRRVGINSMPGRRVYSEVPERVPVKGLDAAFQGAMPRVDWNSRRKTVPLNILLPSTILWAKDLPPQLRPTALMTAFPRIANLLAANWKEPTTFYGYMRSLLFDPRRGGRRGFSPHIKHELVKLRSAYSLRSSKRTSNADREGSAEPALAPPTSASHVATE